MKTPITDAVYPPEIIDREFKEQGRTYGWGTLHDMRETARLLELDRAALIGALKACLAASYDGPMPDYARKAAAAALSAARVNFPES